MLPAPRSVPAPCPSPPARRSSRRLWWIAALLVVVAAVVLVRGVLLRAVGGALVANSLLDLPALQETDAPLGLPESIPVPPGDRRVYLLVESGDSAERVAGAFLSQRLAEDCLLLQGTPSRVVQLGVLPPPAELRIEELIRQGFDRDRLAVVHVNAVAAWDSWRELGRWLQREPHAEVLLLCDQFSSRRQRAIIDAVLPPPLSNRITLIPLRDRRFDETNWWTCRLGIRHVASSYFSFVCFYLLGEQRWERPYRTPEEYEGSLKGEG